MVSPRFFVVLFLALGSVQAWMNGGPWFVDNSQEEALHLIKVQLSEIVDAYRTNDDVSIHDLMNKSRVFFSLFYIPQLELMLARFKSTLEINAYAKYDNHMYAMELVRNVSSPTGWYMTYMDLCEINGC